MSLDDFIRYYDKLEICHLGPDSAKGTGNANNWEGRTEKGAWIRGSSAGGCRNFLNTFAMNPQYRYYSVFNIFSEWDIEKINSFTFELKNQQTNK